MLRVGRETRVPNMFVVSCNRRVGASKICANLALLAFDYLLLTLLPLPLALELIYASSLRLMHARVVHPCQHHSLVSVDHRVL